MSIFRAYSRNRTENERFVLAHGYRHQPEYSLFDSSHLIYPVCGETMQWVRQPLFIHNAKKWLAKCSDDFDVFFALSAFHGDVVPAEFVATRLGKPAFVRVATAHSDLGDKRGLRSVAGLVRNRRRLIHRTNGVIAISEEISEELLGYGIPKEKVIYVPNGTDTQEFSMCSLAERQALRRELGIRDIFTFVFCGALVRKKQPHLAIEGLAHCRRQGYDAQLLLVGPAKDAEYFEELKNLANRYGFEKDVHFIGFVSSPSIYYKISNVFVLPSLREGMSNSMLEAASSGLPVIIGPVSGAIDLNGGGDGFVKIIDVSTAGPIKKAMALYCDKQFLAEQDGIQARRVILERFSSASVYQRHMQIFREAARDG